jgi:hypothetical protein
LIGSAGRSSGGRHKTVMAAPFPATSQISARKPVDNGEKPPIRAASEP